MQQVACAANYSTFLTTDGDVYVCGWSAYGGLGFGPDVERHQSISKIDALNEQSVKQICCGDGHTLAIDEYGRVWSWGNNKFGQLGHGHKNQNKDLPKVIEYFVENDIKTTHICRGNYHNLSLDCNGQVYAWGRNEWGECGDGTTIEILSTPKIVETLKNVDILDIKAGGAHNVAMSKDYDFYIWGANRYYQCMTGNTDNVLVPLKFDPKSNQQLSNALILSILPGSFITSIIASQCPRRKVQELWTDIVECQNTLGIREEELKRSRTDGDVKAQQIKSLQERVQILEREAQAKDQEIEDLKAKSVRFTEEMKVNVHSSCFAKQ